MPETIAAPLCVDGRMLYHSGTGVSTYARILHRVQVELGERSGALIASPSRLPPALGAIGRHVRKTKLAVVAETGAYKLTATDIFKRAHIHFGMHGKLLPVSPALPFGIMHWTYPVPLYFQRWINIYAVHDVIPITQPDLSPVSADRLAKTLQAISRIADAITTISDASSREISALDIFDRNRIINASLAIECQLSPVPDPSEVLTAVGLHHKGYLLFSGSVEERKNVRRMLAAYRQAKVTMPLVIVGPTTTGGRYIEEDIRSTPGAVRLPYQTREALDALVTGAHALIFPSLAEGFGLPVIEAMGRGTAVLTSRIPAISEISGDAALLADPTDVDDLARAIRMLATDRVLADTLASRGIERAALYSFDRFSRQIANVYRHALSRRAESLGTNRTT